MRISDWSSDVCSSDLAAVSAALEEAVREHGLHLLPWPEVARALQARVGFVRGHDSSLPDLSDEALGRSIAEWLPPLLQNIRRLDAISPERLHRVLQAMLGWEGGRPLERMAPATRATPDGSKHKTLYAAERATTATSPRAVACGE